MAWPQGTQFAGKPYREITAAELGIQGLVLAGPGAVQLQLVPWWAGGYGQASIKWAFTLSANSTVQFSIGGVGTDNSNAFLSEQLGNLGTFFPAGNNLIEMAFDDGILPGSLKYSQVVPVPGTGMALNPTWNKSPFLTITLQNLGVGPTLTINAFTILLGGR
jgi:hypothetical protein